MSFPPRVCDSQSKWQSPKLEAYCILRNLVLALWLHNYKARALPLPLLCLFVFPLFPFPSCVCISRFSCFRSPVFPCPGSHVSIFPCLQSYLTAAKCMQALSLRGILRIWCSFHLPNILQFLTERAYVNCGFLSDVPRPLPLAVDRRSHVIVIGAGPAGLASAYHLRTFGYKVGVANTSLCVM